MTKISICLRQKYLEKVPKGECCCTPGCVRGHISSKTFCGARRLKDLKSIVLHECKSEYYAEGNSLSFIHEILESFSVNCRSLENLEIKGDSVYQCFDAAAHMVQMMPRLRCFTFTHNPGHDSNPDPPLLLALAQHCPLLETLNLGEYNDGMVQLVTGCPKLHTITIDSAYVTIDGCRALGQSRSITTLHLNAWCSEEAAQMLAAMADGGMPLKTILIYTELSYNIDYLNWPTFGDAEVSVIARFAPTLESLTINDLLLSQMTDEGLAVLTQCHQLRSIHIRKLKKVMTL